MRRPFAWPVRVIVAGTVALPCLAALGAFRLNNGGDAVLALVTLALAAGLIVYAFFKRHELPDGAIAWLIFALGFTLLLMTSLRGWHVVGHDIAREFRVYTLTHEHALWNIAFHRDPYNACLSITILPELFARFLNISGVIVFKVILQAVFAVCPVVVYVLLRRYASQLVALTGCMLFLCYPTFINDSAMLTRQGVAYLFFALALLVVSNVAQVWRFKLLFFLCALGVVLSHYSTTYMFVALFFVAVGCKLALKIWQQRRAGSSTVALKTVVSPLFALLLFGMAFGWYSQLTGTSGGLGVTLKDSLANIPAVFTADNKSTDTGGALLFSGGRSQAELYHSYLEASHLEEEDVSPVETTFSPMLVSDTTPLTPLGERAAEAGLRPGLLALLRQQYAKVLQVLAVLGVGLALYKLLRRRPDAGLTPDFVYVGVAGILLLGLLVVLPVLSINYGVLRAFQQGLIFLLLPMMLLLAPLGRFVRGRVATWSAAGAVTALFLLFSGFFGQVLGGVSPPLSLNNHGVYFGLYYSTAPDQASFAWMKHRIFETEDVRAANFNRAVMLDPEYPFTEPGILPSQIGPDSYVYLDYAQVKDERFYVYFDGSPLSMSFPIEYYQAAKNRLYSTGVTEVYR